MLASLTLGLSWASFTALSVSLTTIFLHWNTAAKTQNIVPARSLSSEMCTCVCMRVLLALLNLTWILSLALSKYMNDLHWSRTPFLIVLHVHFLLFFFSFLYCFIMNTSYSLCLFSSLPLFFLLPFMCVVRFLTCLFVAFFFSLSHAIAFNTNGNF